ncbi:cysteine desulfurase [Sphingorhabdus rigui]|uniref:Cysteine desulfurase n=1 Tax=Sphingorhabdus rigui TaxID=1282858 RepID=A0A840B2D0_9SPHN|nr:aminotransferase class V-fold PLP-dependent enzyme [Sphingorhabdus rigui]MBB3943060.1 cysteine desulfurase [Sphingorhabdus rigui]
MPDQARIYLDHAATTPIIPAAREAMADAMARWANPSSPHSEGRAARAALENARARVAAALNWDGEVIFTSGASEAIAIALRGHDAIASAVEHDAVLAVAGATRLPVGPDGYVDRNAIKGAGRYAVQSVNNETGVIQPMAEIADMVRANGGILFADCSQSAGKLPLPDADLMCVSAHKLGGPPGMGALLVRNLGLLSPTGGQEQGYRRGTENLPAAIGFATALDAGFAWMENAVRLREILDAEITASGGIVVAEASSRLATIGSYRMPGVAASSQLINFDMAGIAVSAGSACSSGTLKTSHVLGAMGWDERSASEVVRVSFNADTSEGDIARFLDVWRNIVIRAKAA